MKRKRMQFMDCFLPMPVVEALRADVWGAAAVGPRDPGNGMEDRTMALYSYWDGAVVRDPDSGSTASLQADGSRRAAIGETKKGRAGAARRP